ncbi:tumor necrosis factor receptor superfamily member 5 [Triplophysa dalaica]|uniref:tumor necrosis factor receptor superfamily member 5 n=1 Tax=Triplophysa dalaica TaxID=1582913 RepID=UPI0024E03EF5|nr:tumor necrosis factor receptor superfamily member 5 [Triplophysa dalaica]
MKSTFLKLRLVQVTVSVLYSLVAFGNTCGPSEYKSAKGDCCPMCNIGSVVYHDCIGDFSTTCIPCSHGKFMDKPNGLYNCSICKHCSESKGLYIQSQCSTIKDTVCDVLDGYHCTDFTNSQCQHALKHSVCEPGEEIKTPGTKTADTVCEVCPPGFYSPTGVNCTIWTDCAAKNEIETKAGSSITDVTCIQQKRSRYCIIAAVAAAVIPVAIIYFLGSQITQWITSCELKHPIEETNEGCQPSTSHQMP